MPWRRVPDHCDPFANLDRDRGRLAQAFDRRGRPIQIEELFYELEFDYQSSPRLRGLDSNDHRRQPIIRHQNFRPVAERHNRPRASIDDEETSEAVSLGRAMKTLHRQVIKAEDCYTSFTNEFDCDVLSVKEYAGSELLKKLWKNKVLGKQAKEDSDNVDDGAKDFEKKFGEQKKNLLDAMKKAMNSYLKDSSDNEEAANQKRERAGRLVQKLFTAEGQVRVLLDKVPEQQQACKELVAELQLLKTILDPEAEINKDLYKDGGYDDGESNGSGIFGSGSGTQGESWS